MGPVRTLLIAVLMACALAAPASAASPRVVGGSDAPAKTYDSVANVTFASFGCTGTLIAPRWVLTAGHCASVTGELFGSPVNFPPQSYDVVLGTTAADGTGGRHFTVDEVRTPSAYLLTNAYDVSLLHLTANAPYAPVKIAGRGAESLWAPGTLETIAGFGTTKEDGDAPKTMQVARVPIISDADCATAYPAGPPVVSSSFSAATQICAGYPQGGTDTCQGDSGGPLFGHRGDGSLVLVGSTSFGNGCARAGSPGVYARIADATLREWIRGVVPEAIDDSAGGGSAAGSGAGAGSGAAPAAGAGVVSAPRVALAVDPTRRATAAARGVRVRLSCSVACTATLKLRGAAARTLGSAKGRRTLLLRLPRSARSTRLTVVATVRSAGRTSTITRAVALR